ncbi:MAG: hypothetical protein SW833_17570 [Cyanobacteriota bacterium]|nr:hypothetical protein [Cyanobacteriota bacterium]
MIQQLNSSTAELPASWYEVLQEGKVRDRDRYVALAAQFLAIPKSYDPTLALNAVEAYGQSFLASAYPDFSQLKEKPHPQLEAAQNLVSGVELLFQDLGYEVSSWLYWALLHPLERKDIFEPASLRLLEDVELARALDSANHGLNVSMMRRRVDSATSQFGLFVEHGCGCDKHAFRLDSTTGAIDYELPLEHRLKQLRAYFWNTLEEYALFPFRVATTLVYAD